MRFSQTVFRASCAVSFVTAFLTAPRLGAQDALQAVKDLYTSAAYEEAVSAAGKLDAAEPNLELEQYRVFSLVALGRLDEADQAIEAVLTARPEYRPDAAQASPRILALFTQVRRRIGPGLVRRLYQDGRAAMERKSRDDAIARFEAMLRVADDVDVRGEPGVAELKELGAGFLELNRAIGAKPAAETVQAGMPVPAASRPSDLVPPLIVQQRLPPWVSDNPVTRASEFRGAVRVRISAEGRVVSAEMVRSVHPAYDLLLLRAARGWSYEPARKDGIPIASEKTVEVSVKPGSAGPGEWADKSPLD
jgi:TonB family protein